MFCSRCGQAIDDDSRFCRHCGAAQAAASAPPQDTATPPDGTPRPALPRPDGGALRPLWIALGLIAAFVVLAIVASPRPSAPPPTAITDLDMANDMTADGVADPLATPAPTPAPSAATAGPWSYSTDEDKVRGATTYFATTTSTNSIRQAAPYDDATTMTMTVRQSRANGTDVLLRISSGQMMCPSYEGCSGTVRFDDGPPQTVRFDGPADNSSDTIFVVDAADFIARLKKARKLIVEKTLYEAGNPQFEFDVAGLTWNH